MTPRKGARFVHARFLADDDGSGERRYLHCRVTAVRQGRVYYRADDGGSAGQWFTAADRFADKVQCWL